MKRGQRSLSLLVAIVGVIRSQGDGSAAPLFHTPVEEHAGRAFQRLSCAPYPVETPKRAG